MRDETTTTPRRLGLLRGAIALLAVALYAPSIGFDFAGWDDLLVLASNPRMLDPTIDNVAYYWKHAENDLYVPVTQTTWWLVSHVARYTDAAGVVKLGPAAFHLANVIIHALGGILCFELLRRLTSRPIGAALGAAVFVVHPVQVETVCWTAATKDLLAGMFGLAALLVHVAASRDAMILTSAGDSRPPDERRRVVRYLLLSTSFAAAAMLSKPSAIVLPAMAIVIDRFLLELSWKTAIRRALPWVVVAIPIAIVAKLVQPGHAPDAYGLIERVTVAAFSVSFYLGKLIWPARLCFDYGHTPAAVMQQARLGLLVPTLAAVVVVAVLLRRRFPALLAGGLLLVVGIGPVMGLVPFDFQIYSTVGDHYLYLPMIGVALIVAMLPPRAMQATAAVLVVVLMVRSILQIQIWRDRETLSRHNIAINPRSWASYNNLSTALAERGAADEAILAARTAVGMHDIDLTRKSLAGAMVVKADALAAGGAVEAAIALYHEAIAAYPKAALARTNLAATLAEAGRLEDALAEYRVAAEFEPQNNTARQGIAAVEAAINARGRPK